ncbi:ankyrin repeat-containing domain protein, partial [Rhodocollybia butyracea]
TNDVSDIRKWLKAPDPSTNFVAACDKRTPGTGDWIFSDPQFIKWRQAASGVLWIQGKGNTILYSDLESNHCVDDPALLCCYYYFDNRDNSQTKTNARGLFQSLLLQMATRSGGVHPALHELYVMCTEGLMEPTTAELRATLEVVSKELFRWVDCQVTVLQRCKTPKALREAMKKLPKTLEETYTLAIERMREGEHVHDAEKLLMWLTYAFNPLSIAQVTDILAVDLEAQTFDPEMRSLELENGVYEILDSTLITVDMRKVVKLAHNSVKEFLTQTHAEVHIGKFRLTYVNWIRIHDPSSRAAWAGLFDYCPDLGQGKYQINCITWLGHAYVNGQGEQYGSAFQAAVDAGNMDFVQLFLEYHVDVNAQYGSALQEAVKQGNKDMVHLFLEHKADVNAQGGEYGNALQIPRNKGVCQLLLLKCKADVNAQGGYCVNALLAAISQGRKDILELLLEHKADVNAKGGQYGNALQAASKKGNMDIVWLLLEHKVDVNAQGGYYHLVVIIQYYGNALQAAISKGKEDIVRLLLDHKADVNAQGGYYGNALQAASQIGNKDIVQLLLTLWACTPGSLCRGYYREYIGYADPSHLYPKPMHIFAHPSRS